MATLFRGKYRVESARLRGWDYASDASYFVTICTHHKKHYFGKIIDGKMRLNALGEIVFDEWHHSEKIRHEIHLDAFVIMPNHIHGIVMIKNSVETHGRASLHMHNNGIIYRAPKSLSSFIAGFKSICTKRINKIRNTPNQPVWQPGFYDHIIRSERSWFFIREYMSNNPANWAKDKWFQHAPDAVPPA